MILNIKSYTKFSTRESTFDLQILIYVWQLDLSGADPGGGGVTPPPLLSTTNFFFQQTYLL